ncbi:uncharacterized membrane-anchored protein YjiN (DUF445 family) [Nitrosospira multiformis]|uniref:Uncharacterized membrane-anchored protein YjiN (DUF445 family) n=1 Tax=Nitrosospira multiformis TaxID=1231 RepID=A0A2T5IE45_9PROT|nr:DUF445 domain-containing protein [Nitrosospira multiformis]PTQ82094.1 uncharacterized membrane-anchored protein YjiN (DUF445 family) [Nitrosospira multiformis]
MRPVEPAVASNRTRRLATALLIVMLAVLVLANVFLSVHPSVGYVRAFAEAAVVGALADWFAITALFRQPLGLPIPHTAIIPRNKNRIGESLGRFVESNFASPEVVAAKLARVDLSGKLATWLSQQGRTDLFSDYVTRLIPELLDSVDERYVQRFVSVGMLEKAARVDLGPLLGEAVVMLTAEKRHQRLLDKLLREADEYVTANESRIRQRVRENTAWFWQRLSMDEKVGESVVAALREVVAEIARDPEHPLRLRLDAAIGKLASDLATSPEYREQIAAQARKLLEHPALRDYADGVWRDIRNGMREDIDSEESVIRAWVRSVMESGTNTVIQDPDLRERLNNWIRDVLVEAVQSHQRDVGRLIADTVGEWDTETVTRRIERQVGEDLQYIRINGTLIGGLIGLTIYTLAHAFA